MGIIRLVILGLFISSPAIARSQNFDGVYDYSEQKCGTQNTGTRIAVSGNVINFLEGSCELTNPVAVNGMPNAMLYQAYCGGEGETWNYRVLLLKPDAGFDPNTALVYLTDKNVELYSRCPLGTKIYGK